LKKKISLAIVTLLFVFTGVVSAATLWGSYKGSPIVRVKINGAVHKSTVPAISFNSQTYVPLNVLEKSGVKYSFDKNDQTLLIQSDKTNKTVKELSSIQLNALESGEIEASYSFYQELGDENEDWDAIMEIFKKLNNMNVHSLNVDYYSTPDNEYKGSVSISKAIMSQYIEGKLTDDKLADSWEVYGDLFREPMTAKEIAKLQNAVGLVTVFDDSGESLGQGSGFVLHGNIFVTNYHVAGEAAQIKVSVDHQTYDLSEWFYFKDESRDLFAAPISTSYDSSGIGTGKSPAHSLSYTTALPQVGDKVYAIGSPNGLENTLSEGIVSSIRKIDGIDYIQHTAGTELGSSGGVLLNEFGEVIGVTTFGVLNTTLDFAVPMKYFQTNWDNT
jgi:S1-C subfamily serine protease